MLVYFISQCFLAKEASRTEIEAAADSVHTKKGCAKPERVRLRDN